MNRKKIALLIGIVFISLNSMKKDNAIDWEKHKQQFLNWTVCKPLNTEEYWNFLKKGIQEEKLNLDIIKYESSKYGVTEGFLAYQGPIEIQGGQVLVIYPSPYWMCSKLIWDNAITKIYGISTNCDPSFKALYFEQKEKSSLVEDLEIDPKCLLGWNTSSNNMLWYNDNIHKNSSSFDSPSSSFDSSTSSFDSDQDSESSESSDSQTSFYIDN